MEVGEKSGLSRKEGRPFLRTPISEDAHFTCFVTRAVRTQTTGDQPNSPKSKF